MKNVVTAETGPLHPNAPRFVSGGSGHVESWFLRANHPTEPKALWLKITLLQKTDGTTVAEAWCTLFDGDAGVAAACKERVGEDQFAYDPGGTKLRAGACTLNLGSKGSAQGRIDSADCDWQVSWQSAGGPLAEPLALFPYPWMYRAGFPRFKLLTPVPVMSLSGTARLGGTTLDLDGWTGMQGHNWGREHSHEYAWGQCVFPGADGAPLVMVEGFSGKLKLGPVTTPWISALVIRRGADTWRFDEMVDLWRQSPEIDDLTWMLHMRGPDGQASVMMTATPEQMACLGYENPTGRISYCLNSKTARSVLRVNPVNAPGFECVSPHGGALEFLRNEPDPRIPNVV